MGDTEVEELCCCGGANTCVCAEDCWCDRCLGPSTEEQALAVMGDGQPLIKMREIR